MISFAGGLPAADTFPRLSLASFPSALMQYGSSEGEPELRERIAEDLAAIGLRCSPQQVLILSGSQQGIDLAAKLFIDPGTGVGVKSPTYLAALQVMRFFGARFIPYDPRRGATWSAPDSGATLRLNFSHADELETERGLAILAALLMACR
jgi:DNA-binding transcriptional MocR family regulator